MKQYHKTCNDCEEEKPLHGFYKSKTTFDGFLAKCKECVRKNQKPTELQRIRKASPDHGNRHW